MQDEQAKVGELSATSAVSDFHKVEAHLDGSDPEKTFVKIDGTLIKGLQKFHVEIDAQTNLPSVTMVFIPRMVALDIQGRSHILQRVPTQTVGGNDE